LRLLLLLLLLLPLLLLLLLLPVCLKLINNLTINRLSSTGIHLP
jgi:hypothetical protein